MAFVKLTPASGKVSGTNSDMPLLVVPSAITNVGSLTLAEAQSVRFYSDEAKTVELAREVVSADELHVKVSSVTITTDIWMDWDGVRADYAAGDTYGRNAVWSGYGGVWHLNESAGSTATSSTGANNGTYAGTSFPDQVSGKWGNAQAFLGTSSRRVEIAQSAAVRPTNWTISAWIKTTNTGSSKVVMALSGSSTYNLVQVTSTNFAQVGMQAGGTYRDITSTTNVTSGAWFKVTGTRVGTGMTLFVNGASEGTNTLSGNITYPTTSNPRIGRYSSDQGSPFFFTGEIDEVRITSAGVSSDWEATEYQNQNDNGAFWVATPVGVPTNNAGFMAWYN